MIRHVRGAYELRCRGWWPISQSCRTLHRVMGALNVRHGGRHVKNQNRTMVTMTFRRSKGELTFAIFVQRAAAHYQCGTNQERSGPTRVAPRNPRTALGATEAAHRRAMAGIRERPGGAWPLGKAIFFGIQPSAALAVPPIVFTVTAGHEMAVSRWSSANCVHLRRPLRLRSDLELRRIVIAARRARPNSASGS